jgi:hypothetical protein
MKRFWAVVFSFVACAQPLFAEPVLQIPSGITGEGSGNRAGYSTPAVAELDGDSTNGKEIVAASLNGIITAVHADGSPLWKGRVGGNYSASPIALGGRIINVSSDGEVVVIADGESFAGYPDTPFSRFLHLPL